MGSSKITRKFVVQVSEWICHAVSHCHKKAGRCTGSMSCTQHITGSTVVGQLLYNDVAAPYV